MEVVEKNIYCWNSNRLLKRCDSLVKSKLKKAYATFRDEQISWKGDRGSAPRLWNFQKIATSLLMKLFTVCKLHCLTQPPVLQCWMNSWCVWCHFELVSDCLETAFWTCFSTLGIFLSHILKWIVCRFQVMYTLSNAYYTYFINKLLSKFDVSSVNAVLVELFAWGKGPMSANHLTFPWGQTAYMRLGQRA